MHLVNSIYLSACLSRQSLPQDPTEVISTDYGRPACPLTVLAAIIHYQPDPEDCAVIKKDQVHSLVHFHLSAIDLPCIDISL